MIRPDNGHYIVVGVIVRRLFTICLTVCLGNVQVAADAVKVITQSEESHRGPLDCHPTGGQGYRVEEAISPYEVRHYKALLSCGKKERAMAGCAKLKELDSTLLCLFPRRQNMHLSLYRASAYIEKGEVLLTDEELRQDIGFDGHDLMREDLIRYYRAFNKFKHHTGEGHIAQEHSFWQNFLLKKLETHRNLILIAAFDVPYLDVVLSHELLHAQFFSDASYRQAVRNFWENQVEEAARQKIRDRLAELYPTIEALDVPEQAAAERRRAQNVLLNEFQAYTLQIPEGKHLQEMLDLTAPYRDGLRQYLVDCGVPPVRFGANQSLPSASEFDLD